MSEPTGDGEGRETDEAGCGGRHRPAIPGAGGASEGKPPAWASASTAKHTLDARPIIAAGQHPVGQVMELLDTLQGGEVLQLLTPFIPEPLIERVKGRGYRAYTVVEELGLARTFFCKGRG